MPSGTALSERGADPARDAAVPQIELIGVRKEFGGAPTDDRGRGGRRPDRGRRRVVRNPRALRLGQDHGVAA